MNLLQYCFCFMFWLFWLRGMWDLSSPTRDRTHTPCLRRQSLNHRTTREVPEEWFLSSGGSWILFSGDIYRENEWKKEWKWNQEWVNTLRDCWKSFHNFEVLELGPMTGNGYKGRATSVFVSVNLNSTEGAKIPSCVLWKW